MRAERHGARLASARGMSRALVRSVRLLAILASSSVASIASAQQVTHPMPGMTLVTDGTSALAIADLCAAGVSVRATKFAERKATPEGWSNEPGVDTDVAVNADFFDFPGWTLVNGLARGDGEDWPNQGHESRHHFRFGPHLADLQPDTNRPPGGPAITEVVGCHNVIIQGGSSLAPNFDGDAVILGSYRRTAIGLSAGRDALFLFSSNSALSGTALAAKLLQYASIGGRTDLDVACNMDGGGSSQLYVRGQGQIVTSGRLVNNHLGFRAKGTGDAPMCPNHPPGGVLDAAACTGLAGWAQDSDVPTQSIAVHAYFNGPAGASGATGVPLMADSDRSDLCMPLGSCNHGFTRDLPLSLLDAKPHAVHTYAIDSKGGAGSQNPELAGSPKTFTCAPLAVSGVKRWIKSEAVLTAWHLAFFSDVMDVSDAVVASLPDDGPLPDAPVLVRADDKSPEVWLVDGVAKHHVPNPTVAARWQFDLGKVVVWPKAKVDALTTRAPVRNRPVAIRGTGPAVYLVDDPITSAPPPGAGSDSDGGVPTADGGVTPEGRSGDADAASMTSGCTIGRRATSDSFAGAALFFFALALASAARRRRLRRRA